MSLLTEVTAAIKSVLYAEDKRCILCGGDCGEVLCPECGEEYFPQNMARCLRCGKLIPLGQTLCTDCRQGRGPKGLAQVTAWGHYTGKWRDFILTVKYQGQPLKLAQIAEPFAEWAIAQLPPPDVVVAVPLSSNRLAERGYNQAEVLAYLLKWRLLLPVKNGLKRVYDTPTQVKLSRKERLVNLQGAFVWDGSYDLAQKTVWLVDDVTTTGATLEACAQALSEAGAKCVYGLCLAAGMEKTLVSSDD